MNSFHLKERKTVIMPVFISPKKIYDLVEDLKIIKQTQETTLLHYSYLNIVLKYVFEIGKDEYKRLNQKKPCHFVANYDYYKTLKQFNTYIPEFKSYFGMNNQQIETIQLMLEQGINDLNLKERIY